MKVLVKGRPQKGWAEEIPCTGTGNGGGGCNALLLVEEEDLFRMNHSGDRGSTLSFECPECGVVTDVVTLTIPVRLALKVPTKNDWDQKRKSI